MIEKEFQTEGKYTFNLAWIAYIPVMFLIGIVPLIVRLVRFERDEASAAVMGAGIVDDFFSQYKATFILIIAAVMLFALFLIFDKKLLKMNQQIKIYSMTIMTFLLMTFLSAIFSEYRSIAFWGIGDRFEGAMVFGAYAVAMGYTFYVIQKKEDYCYIIGALSFVTLIATIIGFSQYIGKDLLLSTEFGRKLIISEAYAELRPLYGAVYDSRRAHATMFHYNYVGSFTAMTFPLFITLAIGQKGKIKRVIYALLALCSLGLLLMSTSRAGVMGVVVSILVLMIVFSRKILKKWKVTLALVVLGIASIVGANSVTNGIIFERIPSLAADALALFMPVENRQDPLQKLPLQNITHEDNQVVIHSGENLLKVGYGTDRILTFKNAEDQEVSFIETESGVYSSQEAMFENFIFKRIVDEEESEDWALEINGQKPFYFTATEEAGIYLIDPLTKEAIELEEVETFGFEGKERLGSARGYIWSRSIPMLKETLFLGYGPDTYVMKFPQRDYFGKWVAYNTPHMIVDKPHNLYLQISLGQGVIALIAFVGLTAFYSVESLKLYTFKETYRQEEVFGIASFLAVVGYLIAGIFNDSVVSVAPIFWVLLGAGIALNYLVKKQRREEEKGSPYRTIQMKKFKKKW